MTADHIGLSQQLIQRIQARGAGGSTGRITAQHAHTQSLQGRRQAPAYLTNTKNTDTTLTPISAAPLTECKQYTEYVFDHPTGVAPGRAGKLNPGAAQP